MLLFFAFEMKDFKSKIFPDEPGYWTSGPKKPLEKSNSLTLPMTSSIPIGIALVFKTDNVWGKTSSETKNFTIQNLISIF